MGRRALIVANGTFTDSRIAHLGSPAADADRLHDLLRREDVGGYSVTVCKDADLLATRRHIQDFFDRSEYGDLVLMLISGHGIKDRNGRLHFAVRDTELAALRATSLDAQFVIDCLDESAASKKLLFIDTCYSGAFAGALSETKAAGPAVTRDDFGNDENVGKAIITASTSIQFAREVMVADGKQSVFTRHLIEGIRTGDADVKRVGQISLDDVYQYVCAQLKSDRADQTPQPYYFGIDGSTILALNPHRSGKHSFKLADILRHNVLEDILDIEVPGDDGANIPAIGAFIEEFLTSAKVARKYRHTAAWVASEMLSNCFSHGRQSSEHSIGLKIQAAQGGIVISTTQPNDPEFLLEVILADPSKTNSFMQMMKRGGSSWFSKREAGRLEIGLRLRVDRPRIAVTDPAVGELDDFLRGGVQSSISVGIVWANLYRNGDALLVLQVGEIDDPNYCNLQECLDKATDECRSLGLSLLIIDLSRFASLPSRGLRALSKTLLNALLYDIQIVLARPSRKLAGILSISRMDKLLKVIEL